MATKRKKRNGALKKKIALLLTLVCLLTLPGVLSVPLTAHADQHLNGHSLIAENDRYALYMNEEYLSIIVQDKATGKYMESAVSYDDGKNNELWLGQMRSGLLLQLISGTNDTLQADLINDDVTKTVTYTDNGFAADVYWNKYKLGMRLGWSLPKTAWSRGCRTSPSGRKTKPIISEPSPSIPIWAPATRTTRKATC